MTHSPRRAAALIAPLALTVCSAFAQDAAPLWTAEEVIVVEGFQVPECALPLGDGVLVSNIDADADNYWTDDGAGFISLLSPDGEVLEERWLERLDAPKGMCVVGEMLFIADNTRVLMVRDRQLVGVLAMPDAERLNDMASDGEYAYVTDTLAGAIYRLAPGGEVIALKSPRSPNGVTCHEGRVLVASWHLHDVFEVDPAGVEDPRAFGLAERFTNLDGIEVLEDGTILVSDFYGNKVSAISADERSVTTLVELECPADIGVDRERNRLYVPQFLIDKVAVFDLKRVDG